MKHSTLFPYRPRSRASLVPLIKALSLVLVFAAPLLAGGRIYTATPTRYDRVVVHQGDTLWDLVSRRSAAGSDVGEDMYRVAAINHLRAGAVLAPGTVLFVPRP
ncbi:MAG: LysM peptidoglycan-binding domain-containing protein [Candidatus Eremiobacteraeota bacterium]|nr:LysM peptidoglycan-binding domain-containing protein [Candidatus Eremiobacteraeota bacterium]MBC5828541.1 LysM peptidoglycan-binding domain-containing protein [Candidatus Eremiobacteraeota bacterium]